MQVGEQDVCSSGGAGPVVRHLPPLMLRAAFPPGYPSEAPPDAQLLADWLAPSQIRLLQQRLGQLWEEQGPGAPVLYTWIDWLEGCALHSLGIGSVLTLSAATGEQPISISALQRGASDAAPDGKLEEQDVAREVYGRREERICRGMQASCSSTCDGEVDEAGGSCRAGGSCEAGADVVEAVSGADALLARLLHYNSMREAEDFRQVRDNCVP